MKGFLVALRNCHYLKLWHGEVFRQQTPHDEISDWTDCINILSCLLKLHESDGYKSGLLGCACVCSCVLVCARMCSDVLVCECVLWAVYTKNHIPPSYAHLCCCCFSFLFFTMTLSVRTGCDHNFHWFPLCVSNTGSPLEVLASKNILETLHDRSWET